MEVVWLFWVKQPTTTPVRASWAPLVDGMANRPESHHGLKVWIYPIAKQDHQTARSVVEAMGNVENSYRLFMVPGMQHCGGGAGPNQFNAVAALERWREGGVAPAELIAAHVTNNRVDRTRPLCPYPQVAIYLGGDTAAAASFICKAP